MKPKGGIPFDTEKHQPESHVETRRRDLIAEGFALQRQAGRLEQQQRAAANPPPRAVLRALGLMQKPGRRGRKARARINRIFQSKVPEALKK